MPSRSRWNPSTTTRSPLFSPSWMIHWLPTFWPGFTLRVSTLSPSPTTRTV